MYEINELRPSETVELVGVREHGEGRPVELMLARNGRQVIYAENEGGFNAVMIDLLELLAALRERGIIPA